MTGADMVLEALEREGVELIFGYPGGANLPIYQRLPQHPKLKHILVRHEQGAAHMADGYARACGKPGVVFATSGPGALNLVTGLCTAYMDSVPMVAITGQVNSTQVGRDAFQESDVIGATSSVTKHSYLVTSIDQLPRVIHEAFHIATTGRPGPVLIDICKDVQQAEAERVTPERPPAARRADFQIPGYKLNGHVDLRQAREAARALASAERPVILAGHGVLLSRAEPELLQFAEKAAAPVGTTLLGIGAFPVDHPLALHMTGFMGTGWNLKAVQNADVLMMVGMRVDDRVTARLADFAPSVKTFIHIDIDGSEMGKNVRPHIELVADADRRLARGAPAPLHALQRPPAASGRADRHVPARAQRGHRRRRRRPEPDLGGPVGELRQAGAVHQLRRLRHDGLRPPGGDRREVRAAGAARLVRRRRGRLRDDRTGALGRGRAPARREDSAAQQLLARHGPPVPGRLLRWRPLAGRPDAHAGLRQARRGVRPARRSRRHARGGRARDGPRREDQGPVPDRFPDRPRSERLPDRPAGQEPRRFLGGS